MAQDPAPAKQNTMQLAEILSDLVSLRVCDPNAALALVSARSDSSSFSTTTTTTTTTTAADTATAAADADTTKQQDDSDPDLKRAKDLLKLHVEVKEAQKRGELSRRLEEARGLVEKAVG